MPKPPNSSKSNKKPKSRFPVKAFLGAIIVLLVILLSIVGTSLFKNYPVEGKKQLLVISSGDTYSRFIDRLAKENKVNFPIILKLYQKFMIHDSM